MECSVLCASEGLVTALGKDLQHTTLCKAVKGAKMKEIVALVRDARFICEKCGRAAANKGNLCAPRKLGK